MNYAGEQDLLDYLAARGITLTGDATPTALLTRAHDYLESLEYKGTKATSAQANQWPRYGVTVDGYSVDSSAVPSDIISAECAVAYAIDSGYDPMAPIERAVVMERVEGAIQTQYSEGSVANPVDPLIMAKLRKYAASAGGSTFSVHR